MYIVLVITFLLRSSEYLEGNDQKKLAAPILSLFTILSSTRL